MKHSTMVQLRLFVDIYSTTYIQVVIYTIDWTETMSSKEISQG